MTTPESMADGPSYTWTCLDCPAWAGRYWASREAAARDPAADEHESECPGAGRIAIVGRSAQASAENLGLGQRIGAYDPDELLLVPYWAVLAARGLAGVIGRQVEHGRRVDMTDPAWAQFVGGTVLAARPLPDVTTPQNSRELAALLRRLADTLSAALPNP